MKRKEEAGSHNEVARVVLSGMLEVSLQQLDALKQRHLDPLDTLLKRKEELMREYDALIVEATPEIKELMQRLNEIEAQIRQAATEFMVDVNSQIFLLRSALQAREDRGSDARFVDEKA